RPIAKLIERASARSRKQLLDERTEIVGGKRKLSRGPRYRDLPRALRADIERAFRAYVAALPEAERKTAEAFEPLDIAFRIAGTGSLGTLRAAVLVAGKGGRDGAWIFDMKEEGGPSPNTLLPRRGAATADRVASAMSACLEHPPRMLGVTSFRGR